MKSLIKNLRIGLGSHSQSLNFNYFKNNGGILSKFKFENFWFAKQSIWANSKFLNEIIVLKHDIMYNKINKIYSNNKYTQESKLF